MKPTANLINTARGELVDFDAVIAAIEAGLLAGAALDVFPKEPKAQGDAFESALRGLDNVILTPHVAASTLEAQEEIGRFVGAKLINYVSDGNTGLSVNLPNVTPPTRVSSQRDRVAVLFASSKPFISTLAGLAAEHGNQIVQQQGTTRDDVGYVVSDTTEPVSPGLLAAIRDTPGVRWARTHKTR
jgi:D-3-phosphoglycerate dehydrogenase